MNVQQTLGPTTLQTYVRVSVTSIHRIVRYFMDRTLQGGAFQLALILRMHTLLQGFVLTYVLILFLILLIWLLHPYHPIFLYTIQLSLTQ